jgi:hypothetical protein
MIDDMIVSSIRNNGLTGIVEGLYHARTRTIMIYPDASTLTSIIAVAIDFKRHDQSILVDRVPNLVKDDVSSELARTLNHEIIHSSQHGFQIIRQVRPLVPAFIRKRLINHYHEKALDLEDNPELLSYAEQSIAPYQLISDAELLDLYSIARESYLLHQERK